MRHINFSRWRPSGNLLPGLGLVTALIYESGNLDEIPQSSAKIKLLPGLEKGRPPYWDSTSGLILTHV